MNPMDRALLSKTPISHGAYLERVINHGGVPYSCVIYNGDEVCNAPTADEKGLINYWETDAYKYWTKVVDGRIYL